VLAGKRVLFVGHNHAAGESPRHHFPSHGLNFSLTVNHRPPPVSCTYTHAWCSRVSEH
jgi:hypothetical protein